MKNRPLRQCDVFATVGEFFLVYFLLYLFLPGLMYVQFGIIDTPVVGIYIFINPILWVIIKIRHESYVFLITALIYLFTPGVLSFTVGKLPYQSNMIFKRRIFIPPLLVFPHELQNWRQIIFMNVIVTLNFLYTNICIFHWC